MKSQTEERKPNFEQRTNGKRNKNERIRQKRNSISQYFVGVAGVAFRLITWVVLIYMTNENFDPTLATGPLFRLGSTSLEQYNIHAWSIKQGRHGPGMSFSEFCAGIIKCLSNLFQSMASIK